MHGVGGAWGMLAVGLFAQTDHITDVQFSRFSSNSCHKLLSRKIITSLTAASYDGLFWAGDAYLLGVQALAVLVITLWSMVSTFVLLFTIDLVRKNQTLRHDTMTMTSSSLLSDLPHPHGGAHGAAGG